MTALMPKIVTFTADDGYRFHCRRWDVENAAGDVIVLHGIISHSGWYLETGSNLAAAGFNVHSLDRRGSGLNLQDRGDVTTCDRWIDDVIGYIRSIQASQSANEPATGNKPPRPIFLVGISWGSLLATAVARRLGNEVSGLVLLCPGFFSRKGTSQIQHTAVKIATNAGLGGLRFPVPLRDPELFTRSASWRAYIADDPFTLRRVTLRLATASAKLYHDVVKTPVEISTPTLLMLGGQDLIIHNDQVSLFVKRYFGEQPKIIEYPTAAHTLEFEDDTIDYMKDLSDWCVSRSAAARSN